jgi:hypothetical protein
MHPAPSFRADFACARRAVGYLGPIVASSVAKDFYRTFGSLKLAVVTLSTLTVVLIWATFYESKTSTPQVQMVVYQSWWFIGLLFLLAVNVFCAAMARYPWKGYQTGFVITHAGIIVLLLGSIIGLLFGVEGSITMVEGGPPREFLTQDYEVVNVTRHDTRQSISAPLGVDRRGLKPGETRRVKLRPFPLHAIVKARHPNTKEEVIVRDGGEVVRPAVRFNFTSKLPGMETTGMHVTEWLIAGDPQRETVSVGPAVFKIETVDSEAELARRIEPPPSAAAQGKGLLVLHVGDQAFQIPVEEYLAKDFRSPDGGVTVRLREYFADLRMATDANGRSRPVSVSDEPNNPAVLYEVTTSDARYLGFAFADHPEVNFSRREGAEGEAHGGQAILAHYLFERTGQGGGGMSGLLNTITVLVGPGEALHFTSSSKRSGFHAGELKVGVGAQVSPQSPMQPELTIEEFYLKPIVTTRYVPAPTNELTQFVFPAVELTLVQGDETKDLFLRWGESEAVTLGGVNYHLSYGWATVPLGFSIQLERFNVPKHEGTEMDAGYESYVKVVNPKSGEEFSQKIWMNHPLTYKGFRISQASFDRPDAGGRYRSTLQALKDPGWPLKALGSILIVGGIITMFYLKPYLKGRREEMARRAAAEKQKGESAPELMGTTT